MPLKRVLENLDDLDENLKSLYVQRGSKWFLDADEDDAVDALRRAKERETEAARKLREDIANLKAEYEAKLAEAQEGGTRPKKIDELENSWRNKLTEAERKANEKLAQKDEYIRKFLLEAEAGKISDIFNVPTVGRRLIQERLTVEFGEDGPKVRVLDAAGSPSAMTIDELRKEFVDSKELAPLIIATNASGGGASGANGGKGGGGAKPFAEMNSLERTELYRKDPARFTREANALKGH